jgi:hypothetical protein
MPKACGLTDWPKATPEQQKEHQAEYTAVKAKATNEVSASLKQARRKNGGDGGGHRDGRVVGQIRNHRLFFV